MWLLELAGSFVCGYCDDLCWVVGCILVLLFVWLQIFGCCVFNCLVWFAVWCFMIACVVMVSC